MPGRIIEITSLDHPGLAPYAHLTEAQLRSREGIFIAESRKVILHALDAGYEPLSLLMEKRHLLGQGRELIERCDADVFTGERELLASLTGYALTRGMLCAMRRRPSPAPGEVLRGARRIAVLEGIVDPTNVGAIFRSAAALGVDGLLLSPTCCDPLHRRAVRVSMGTVFQLPWTRLEKWPDDGVLAGFGFKTCALALSDSALPITDARLAAEERLAMVLGAEGDGLAPDTIAACDYCAIIPMRRGVDSLNVAAASAVAFWQLCSR